MQLPRTGLSTTRAAIKSLTPSPRRCWPGCSQQPFADYSALPPLRAAVAELLSPAHAHGDRAVFGATTAFP